MGYFRFRRNFRLFPGVRVNLSKSGVSTSIGRRGLWFVQCVDPASNFAFLSADTPGILLLGRRISEGPGTFLAIHR